MDAAPLLICYDGSDESRHAIEQAARLLGHGPAIVLNTWEVLTVAVGGYPLDEFGAGIPFEQLDEASRRRGERVAADGAELARSLGFAAEPVVREGPAAEAIVDEARATAAKAIVLGSRGFTGLKGSLLGSVSQAVIHHAPCPVLVVRHEDETAS